MLTKEPSRKYSAMEQCRAVLLLWTERRSKKELCREMKVSGSLLAYWQDKAMTGLIAALTPREGREVAEKGPALSIGVKRLLEKKVMEHEGQQRAQTRLARITRRLAPSSPPAATTEG